MLWIRNHIVVSLVLKQETEKSNFWNFKKINSRENITDVKVAKAMLNVGSDKLNATV